MRAVAACQPAQPVAPLPLLAHYSVRNFAAPSPYLNIRLSQPLISFLYCIQTRISQ